MSVLGVWALPTLCGSDFGGSGWVLAFRDLEVKLKGVSFMDQRTPIAMRNARGG